MKCPECKQEMKPGYVGLSSGIYASALFFKEESPSEASQGSPRAIRLMDSRIIGRDWGGYTRRAYRCESCDITVIGRRILDKTDPQRVREEDFERVTLITGPRTR